MVLGVARLKVRERRLMPRESFPRKCDGITDSWAVRPRARAATISCLMTPDDSTPAMQNPEKEPEKWATGGEPMTGPQRSYLQTLCREAGEEFNENLTKAEASKKIEELQAKTGRGKKS